jgi:phosphohistidine phosphatase
MSGVLTLHLLRHAKSSWDDPAMEDFDRPLNKRGVREAEWAATELARHAARPALVLCSPALRTRETLASLTGWLGDTPIKLEPRIYEASVEVLLSLVRQQGANPLLMIGHNPGFEGLARLLAGDGDKDAVRRLARKYPPAGLATLVFDARAWTELKPAMGRLLRFETPDD